MKRKRPSPTPSLAGPSEGEAARYRALLGEADYNALLGELDRPLRPALRLNTLKASAADLENWRQTYGWELEPVPYCTAGRWVTQQATPISRPIEHRLGFYYIQDAASMLPVELFDFDQLPAHPLVLDMAASPGGKTTHLIDKTGDTALVVANDSSADRIMALRLVLQTWGAVNSAVVQFPGERYGAWFPETFDLILLDAPCSMHNLRSTESHPMRPISEKERSSLATRQTRLLFSAFQALKPGGQMVYSTCTLAPEEDEAVLDTLLSQYGSAVQVNDMTARLPVPAPGLTTDGTRQFDPAVQHAVRLWPHRFSTSGFFAARLTKRAAIDAPTSEAPERALERTSLEFLPRKARQELFSSLQDQFGMDMESILSRHRLSPMRRMDTLFAIPDDWLNHFASLPFQAVGMPVGEYTPDGFSLSHEWVSRFCAELKHGWITLPADAVPAWLKGEDISGVFEASQPRGRTLPVRDEDGRLLGRGKLQSARLKNLLPRRLASG